MFVHSSFWGPLPPPLRRLASQIRDAQSQVVALFAQAFAESNAPLLELGLQLASEVAATDEIAASVAKGRPLLAEWAAQVNARTLDGLTFGLS